MKRILIFILLFVMIPYSFAQEMKKYDQYDCIIERVLDECADKTIYVVYEGKWQSLTESGKQNREFLRKLIIDKEKEVLLAEKGTFTTNTHFIITCNLGNRNLESESEKTLGYFNDHFVWEGHTIDCAWIRQDVEQLIQFTGKCPIFNTGGSNQFNQNCRDINLNFGDVVLFSLGGLTLLGIGYSIFKFVKKRKAKKKQAPQTNKK